MRVSRPDSERGSPGSRLSTSVTSQPLATSLSASADPKIPPPTTSAEVTGLLDDGDGVAGGDRAALGDGQLLDGARARRGDLVLHLHRLDHADERALVNLGALLDSDLEHCPLKRRDDGAGRPAARVALALAPRCLLHLGCGRGPV